jgi:hypothetical protein
MRSAFTRGGGDWTCEVFSWGKKQTLVIADANIPAAYCGFVAATIVTPDLRPSR